MKFVFCNNKIFHEIDSKYLVNELNFEHFQLSKHNENPQIFLNFKKEKVSTDLIPQHNRFE